MLTVKRDLFEIDPEDIDLNEKYFYSPSIAAACKETQETLSLITHNEVMDILSLICHDCGGPIDPIMCVRYGIFYGMALTKGKVKNV